MSEDKYFSIGEIAELTGVTVRTLQYYDNIGLIPLNREPRNNHRYFTESDLTRLQQVLFYKSLGLYIEDIKKLLVEAISAEQISSVLEKQRDIFYHKLNDVKHNIAFIEATLVSIKENKSLSLERLVQLISSLNKDTFFEYENVYYGDKSEKTFLKHYDNNGEILEVYWEWKSLVLEAVSLILNDNAPESKQGQDFAEKWVEMILEITGGSQDLLEAHKRSYENREQWPKEDCRLMEFTDEFIDRATEFYLTSVKKDNFRNLKK